MAGSSLLAWQLACSCRSAAVLTISALTAVVIPAWRASRLDPAIDRM